MIQRIQTVYLLIVTVISIIFQSGKIMRYIDDSEKTIILNIKGLFISDGGNTASQLEKMIPVTFIMVIIPLLSVITILLYRKRKLQMKFAAGLIFVILLLSVALIYLSLNIMGNYNATFVPAIVSFLPVLMLVFAVLARRGIKKDEELVKSYDRLR